MSDQGAKNLVNYCHKSRIAGHYQLAGSIHYRVRQYEISHNYMY